MRKFMVVRLAIANKKRGYAVGLVLPVLDHETPSVVICKHYGRFDSAAAAAEYIEQKINPHMVTAIATKTGGNVLAPLGFTGAVV